MTTPTAAQTAALAAYAAKHGRSWKSRLIHTWMTGQTQYEEHAAELQQVRNNFGPSWLRTYSTTITKPIVLRYSSIDRFSKTATFKTLKGARAFARKWVGRNADVGSFYAVSGDGIGKIVVVEGCKLTDLFPSV